MLYIHTTWRSSGGYPWPPDSQVHVVHASASARMSMHVVVHTARRSYTWHGNTRDRRRSRCPTSSCSRRWPQGTRTLSRLSSSDPRLVPQGLLIAPLPVVPRATSVLRVLKVKKIPRSLIWGASPPLTTRRPTTHRMLHTVHAVPVWCVRSYSNPRIHEPAALSRPRGAPRPIGKRAPQPHAHHPLARAHLPPVLLYMLRILLTVRHTLSSTDNS